MQSKWNIVFLIILRSTKKAQEIVLRRINSCVSSCFKKFYSWLSAVMLLYYKPFRYPFAKTDNVVSKSSHQRCSVKKGVLINFAKFTGKHLCQSLFLNKVAGATLLKKILWHRCFPVNFAKFIRTPPDDCFWVSHKCFPHTKGIWHFVLLLASRFKAETSIKKEAVSWFTSQINWLVSMCW